MVVRSISGKRHVARSTLCTKACTANRERIAHAPYHAFGRERDSALQYLSSLTMVAIRCCTLKFNASFMRVVREKALLNTGGGIRNHTPAVAHGTIFCLCEERLHLGIRTEE